MIRILIADDEALECRVLEKIIYDNLKDVLVLPFAKDGLELVSRAEKEHPDIVIADINMPGLGGLDAIDYLHRKDPNLLVLVVTAYSRFEYAQRALSLGASGYLLKPVKEKEFVSCMRDLLSRLQKEQEEREVEKDTQIGRAHV